MLNYISDQPQLAKILSISLYKSHKSNDYLNVSNYTFPFSKQMKIITLLDLFSLGWISDLFLSCVQS